MNEVNAIALRDQAKYQLEQIRDLETGIEYLNKVKAIEVWAKAEKKDAELQNIVAEQKLRTQRVLGKLISEGKESGDVRGKGNLPGVNHQERNIPDVNITQPKSLTDLGITAKESHTFQQIANIPDDKFESFIEEKKSAVDRAVGELTTAGALRLAKGTHVTHNSGEFEWYTPERYIVSARKVMGSIDLDPASSDNANRVIKAKRYFDEDSNGLLQKWSGNIWLNPPYAQPQVTQFIEKFETETFNQAIILVNNWTDTKAGQKLLELSNAVCFNSGRISFINPDGEERDKPLQGQMIAYIGPNYKAFIDEFKQFGVCLRKGL